MAHAIECLTVARSESAVVPRNHVRKIKDFMDGKSTSYDAAAASALDEETIAVWEAFWDAHFAPKTAGELKIAYLAGPEPLNDFRVLIELGVHPFNIWAFETDNPTYNAALMEVAESEFPLLKLRRGSLDAFLRTAPTVFDIIYLDACGPLPSTGQSTLRTLVDIFRYNGLASPGVLITNFAAPDESDEQQASAYADLVSASLYPRPFLEAPSDSEVDSAETWNMDDGPQAHGFVCKDQMNTDESFFHEVRKDLQSYYGQYITRQIFDVASLIAPWTVFANSEAWNLYLKEPASKVAASSADFGPSPEDDVTVLVTDSDMNAIGWTLNASKNGKPYDDVNYPILETGSVKLIDSWRKQLSGQPTPKVSAEQALIAYHVIRSEEQAFETPAFDAILNGFRYLDKMFLFCDVPNDELALLPLVAQYTRPMHYNVERTRRFSYVAKSTRMFMDVVPFDACRYVYDWLPPVDMAPSAFELENFQLAFRFALDGIAKHTIRYNREYFFGVHVAGVNHEGFCEKLLKPRKEIGEPNNAL
ncbi:hypothetical protein [Pseudoblastomonas halimionae]|uniref:hypothetical protein n=1 Tax=Alteriqipengyuania halimionae TaxID=1926630 RepID=UPI001371539D|nr:hypothetical protein [Alteriqipengyuania halimionae]